MTPQRNTRTERSSSEPEKQQPLPKQDPDMPSSSSSSSAYSPFVYPPGLRFVPTDEELILYYLKPFSQDNKIPWPNLPIHRANIYESNPQQLSVKYEKGNLKEWFFISERTKINKDGKKQKRSDHGGYWHATGAKKINPGQGVVSYKTALSYYVGKQPNGVKSNWLMQEYWLESSHENKTVDYALCKIYLSPMAKNKQKEEGVEEEAEALKEEVVQPRNVENQQPQPQPQPFDISDYQQPQFLAAELDLRKSQRRDIGYNELHPLDTIDNQRSRQLQFLQATLDSNQTQPHDVAHHRSHQPQPLGTIDHQQSPRLQFWQAILDSCQKQPHDIAYHQPHQPQPLDTFQYQLQRSRSAPLGSHQSHFHDIQYHQSQIFPSPLDSDQPQPHHNLDGDSIDTGESNNSG